MELVKYLQNFMESSKILREKHHCECAVLTCMDFRMWERVARVVRERCGVDCCDLVSLPGAAKNILDEKKRESALEALSIAANLHGVKTVVLVNHEDCGAYGGSAKFSNSEDERGFHKEELRKAADVVRSHLPDVQVVAYFAHFTPDGRDVAIDEIL